MCVNESVVGIKKQIKFRLIVKWLEKAQILSDQQLQCSHVQHKYTVQSKMLKVKNTDIERPTNCNAATSNTIHSAK